MLLFNDFFGDEITWFVLWFAFGFVWVYVVMVYVCACVYWIGFIFFFFLIDQLFIYLVYRFGLFRLVSIITYLN